jgi:hypothetical protein
VKVGNDMVGHKFTLGGNGGESNRQDAGDQCGASYFRVRLIPRAFDSRRL